MLRYNPASLHAARTDEGKISMMSLSTCVAVAIVATQLPIMDVNVQFIW